MEIQYTFVMKKIVYIADPEILAIPIKECGESFIDLKDQTEIGYGPVPENEFTANDYTKMRKTVYEKLCTAQKTLPEGWRFRLYEGLRSRKVQKMLFDAEHAHLKIRLAGQTPAEIFRETTRLVSPIENFDGSRNIPPHSTGAAVDVEIVTEKGQVVDMGMEAKDWDVVVPEMCLTNCHIIDENIQANRKILFDVMTAQDFVNMPTEWWHFSYGDRYWAYHKNQAHAIYDGV